MGVDIIGTNKSIGSLKIIAKMIARMSENQKLKQKSQSNNLEINRGARIIISFLISSLSINKMPKAAILAAIKATSIIKYIVGIILLLLI